MTSIFFDHASATPIDPEVKKTMARYLSVFYGNPSSMHTLGLGARHVVEDARSGVAKILGCKLTEILFTSGGTEGNNLAIQGVCRAQRAKGRHIITTVIEHSSILETCKYLEKEEGYKISYLRVDNEGFIDLEELAQAIQKDTVLISIGYANSEIGVIQDVAKIGEIAREHNVVFHTDACQAAGCLDLDVSRLHVDLMTLNGAKIYGPKGVGVLYKRTGVPLKPLFFGGGQEFGYRSGTENVSVIVGFAKALEIAEQRKKKEVERLMELRNYLIERVLTIPGARLNGPHERRLPNNANFTFRGTEGESLMLFLNDRDVLTSTGSACASKSSEPSPVLTALGLSYKDARASLRITMGNSTRKKDVDALLEALTDALRRLRVKQ